jgi:hypothetical protein
VVNFQSTNESSRPLPSLPFVGRGLSGLRKNIFPLFCFLHLLLLSGRRLESGVEASAVLLPPAHAVCILICFPGTLAFMENSEALFPVGPSGCLIFSSVLQH